MKKRLLTYREFVDEYGPFGFGLNPLDVNLTKMQHELIEKLKAEDTQQAEKLSIKENYESRNPEMWIKDVTIECLQSDNLAWGYSVWLTVTERDGGQRQEEKKLFIGDSARLASYLSSRKFLADCKGAVLYIDYLFENFKSFQDYVDDLVLRIVERIEKDVPDTGNFADILELFTNPSYKTKSDVGRYGLRVFKMRPDVDPDPAMRYVEAAAYDPSGTYKSNFYVAAGTKEEVLAQLHSDEFSINLTDDFVKLTDALHDA